MTKNKSPGAYPSYELGDPFAAGHGDDAFLSIAIDSEKNTGYALQYTPGFEGGEYTIFPFDTKTHKMGTPITSPLFEAAGSLTLDASRRILWVISATGADGPILVPIDLAQTPPRVGQPITTPIAYGEEFIDFEVYPDSKTGYAVISNSNGEPSDVVPVDLTSRTFGEPIPVGVGFAENIAFDGQYGRAYVTAENGKIIPIDLVNKKPLDPILLSAKAVDIVIDKVNRTAYVLTYARAEGVSGPADAGRYYVEPFNLDTRLPGKPIPVGSDIPIADSPSIVNIALDKALHRIYVTHNVSSSDTAAVTVINGLTNTPYPPISLGLDDPAYTEEMPIEVDPVTHTVYIGSGGAWVVPLYPSIAMIQIASPASGSTVQSGVPLIISGTGEPGAIVRTVLAYGDAPERSLPNTTVKADGTWSVLAGTPKVASRTYAVVSATQYLADHLAQSTARSNFYIA